MFHFYNGAILLLIFVGVLFRRQRNIHVPMMVSSCVLDLASVLYLELTRGVIGEAIEKISSNMMQMHLVFASLTLIGYGIAIYTGRRILKGDSIYKIHRTNAILFLIARSGVFVTSFFVHTHHS